MSTRCLKGTRCGWRLQLLRLLRDAALDALLAYPGGTHRRFDPESHEKGEDVEGQLAREHGSEKKSTQGPGQRLKSHVGLLQPKETTKNQRVRLQKLGLQYTS